MKTKGFTSIDSLVVLAVLSILAVGVLPSVGTFLEKERIAEAQTGELQLVSDALRQMMGQEELDFLDILEATNDMSVFPNSEHSLYPKYLKEKYTQWKYSIGPGIQQEKQ